MEKLSIEGGGEDLEQIGAVKRSDLEKIINKSEKGIVNRGKTRDIFYAVNNLFFN